MKNTSIPTNKRVINNDTFFLKKEQTKKYLLIIIPLLLIIILLFISNKTSSPFEYLKIIDKEVKINNKNNYNIEIECRNLTSINEQIIDYKLKKVYQDKRISIASNIYNKDNELIENYNDISKINFNIKIDKYDYEIIATCK